MYRLANFVQTIAIKKGKTDVYFLQQEFELLQSWGLSETDLAQATFSAARASFCGDGDRKELMKELRKVFGIEDKVELEIFINHKCGHPDDPRKVLKTSF